MYTFLLIIIACVAPLAHACGGFFCSNRAPMLQAAERIAFMVHDKTDMNVIDDLYLDAEYYERRVQKSLVTAIIQIAYSGPAHEFSWVLPLPSVPDKIDVSDDRLFVNLEQATKPTFTWEGFKQNASECPYPYCQEFELGKTAGRPEWCPDEPRQPGGYVYGRAEVALAADSGGQAKSAGVVVVASGEAGAYVYEVVVDQSRDGGKMFKWLNDNGYDQPPSSERLIQHYAKQQMPFVAVKLQSDKDTGDIAPLMLTYPSDTMSCIPLRLTAIAAEPGMPIYSWVLGPSRAVTTNFFNVEVDLTSIDFLKCVNPDRRSFSGGPFGGRRGMCEAEYAESVSEAVKAVGGRAFVTEYAGASSVYQPIGERIDTAKLRSVSNASALITMMLSQGFTTNGQLQSVFRRNWPMPSSGLSSDCSQERTFYAQWNVDDCIWEAGIVFDANAFVDDLEELVSGPIKRTDKLMQSLPYMTRLYTTMGPEDMIRDPFMKFTSKLGDVSSNHSVTAYATCGDGFVDDDPATSPVTTTCFSWQPKGKRISHATAVRVVVDGEQEATYEGKFPCAEFSQQQVYVTLPTLTLAEYDTALAARRITLLNESDGSELEVPLDEALARDAQLTDTFELPCPELYKICEGNKLASAQTDCTFDCSTAVSLSDLWRTRDPKVTRDGSISTGLIIGIVVGVLFVLGIGAVVIYNMRKQPNKATSARPGSSTEMTDKGSAHKAAGSTGSGNKKKKKRRSSQHVAANNEDK